eukprot:4620570-Amphidinium_carterae.1
MQLYPFAVSRERQDAASLVRVFSTSTRASGVALFRHYTRPASLEDVLRSHKAERASFLGNSVATTRARSELLTRELEKGIKAAEGHSFDTTVGMRRNRRHHLCDRAALLVDEEVRSRPLPSPMAIGGAVSRTHFFRPEQAEIIQGLRSTS